MTKNRTPVADRLDKALNTRFEAYQHLIRRIQEAVDQFIPVGSTVLVVSKGDPALLAIGQRTGWHFPRAADGQYAGFHPVDSNDAIARLDVQRQLGARYLVIPSTSAWWLDHYPEFIAYVRSCGRTLLEDPGLGSIFELSVKTAPTPAPVSTNEAPRPSTQQLIDLLEAVLPTTATIAIIAARDDDLVSHSPRPAIALCYIDDAVIDVKTAIRELRKLADGIADFLVVPISSREWLDGQPALAKHVEESYSLVTDQRNVCRIYDLRVRAGEDRHG
jgi:hypothetical protein